MKSRHHALGVDLVAAVAWLGLSWVGLAADPTAFGLVREGNRHVGDDVKDRVVCIRSEKSVGSLTPSVWSVFFLDPASAGKVTEVKFAAGSLVEVSHQSGVLGISGLRENPGPCPWKD